MSMRRFNEALLMGMSPEVADKSAPLYKKDAPAPDYTPLIQASREASQVMERLGNRQLNFAEKQFAAMNPLIQRIGRTQASAMDQQMAQARDYYNYNKETFRPLEEGLVRDAEEFNTAAARERLASRAAADAGLAFNRTNQANERAMRSMGVNPNSGAALAARAQSGLGLAASRAAAMTGARNQARDQGYGMRMQAAGLGRGLPQQSLAAFQGATGSGTAAANSYMAPGNQYMTGMAQGASTIGAGHQMGIQGLSSALQGQAQAYAGQQSGIGSAIGSIAGAGMMIAAGGSDRRLKENIEKVGVDEATGLNLYEFNYRGHPGTRLRGVMADEVLKVQPDAVHYGEDGYMYVDYKKIGIEMREVQS